MALDHRRLITVYCPVDVEVLNGTGAVAASVIHNSPSDSTDSGVQVFAIGDEKLICLTGSGSYSLRLTGTGAQTAYPSARFSDVAPGAGRGRSGPLQPKDREAVSPQPPERTFRSGYRERHTAGSHRRCASACQRSPGTSLTGGMRCALRLGCPQRRTIRRSLREKCFRPRTRRGRKQILLFSRLRARTLRGFSTEKGTPPVRTGGVPV